MSLSESFLFLTEVLFVILVLLKLGAYFTLGVSRSKTCMIGKTVLITGGNSGLGYQTALALASRGARIIIADKVDATESIHNIIERTGNENVAYKHFDLNSLASVRQLAKEINAEEERLDVLINNAGCGAFASEYTEDDILLEIQVNYLGAFLLTHLLIDLLKKSAPSRILFVSSILAFINNITLENFNKRPETRSHFYSFALSYGNTKILNIIAANIFAEKLNASGVTSNSLHPGVVATPIFRTLNGQKGYRMMEFLIYRIILPLYGKNAWDGAQTHIECAISKKLENVSGKFFVDCKPFVQPRKALNRNLCMKLWNKSEELVKLADIEKLR